MSDCGHGIALASYVERCAECGEELVRRPPKEDNYRAAVKDVLARDFAAEEDIATINELDGLHAYERGVMDVQERLAGLTNDL